MTYLQNYDSDGFIIGNKRLSEGIERVQDDTQEIVQILKSQNQIANTRMSELSRVIKQSIHQQAAQARLNTTRLATSQRRDARNQSPPPTLDIQSDRTTVSRARLTSQANDNVGAPASPQNNRSNNSNEANNRRTTSSRDTTPRVRTRQSDNPPATRERDARGRWVRNGADDTNNPDTTNSDGSPRRERDASGRFTSDGASQSGFSRLSSEIKALGSGAGGSGSIDPVLDSLKEAKDLLSPIGRTAKLASKGAKLSYTKLKALKRREPLPADQDRHNRENEKLLDKIWKAIRKQGNGGGGGGLLSSLLGGAAGAGGRGRGGLIRRGLGLVKGKAGIIGATVGAGLLASNWSESTTEEKTAGVGGIAGGLAGAGAGAAMGAAAGSVIPGVGNLAGGLVGGLVGGWQGMNAGEALGQAVTPYVSRWTDSLDDYKLPEKMQGTWEKGLTPIFSHFNKMGADTRSSIGSLWDKVKRFLSGDSSGGGDGGYGATESIDPNISGAVTQKASKAADLITAKALTTSSGYCARFVRQGLQQAGYDLKTAGEAKNYANGALTDAGFSEIGKNMAPQKGDVMVMPAQGKHTAGHIQMYNGTQWVSDFKQKRLNPWGDIDDKNLKYKTYRDLRGQQAAGGTAVGRNGGSNAKTTEALNYFMSQGWTKEQAAGIVGNLQKESGFFSEDVISGRKKGDGGKAYGIAQWHPDRQQNFKKAFGKSITQSTFKDQLKFVNHELTKGTEQSAGSRLRKATSAAQAGAIVSQFYERPAAVEAEKRERAILAENVLKSHKINNTGAPKPAPTSGAIGVSAGNTKAKNGFMPESTGSIITDLLETYLPNYAPNIFQSASRPVGISPATLPALPSIKMPTMPRIQQRLDSGSDSKPLIVQASNDTINQNVSDRGLAHAITGGLGQETRYG